MLNVTLPLLNVVILPFLRFVHEGSGHCSTKGGETSLGLPSSLGREEPPFPASMENVLGSSLTLSFRLKIVAIALSLYCQLVICILREGFGRLPRKVLAERISVTVVDDPGTVVMIERAEEKVLRNHLHVIV